MSYPDADTLIQSFAVTGRLIHLQTEGLSHEDSLLQLPFRGNCLNWVLGHIVVGRNRALLHLEQTPVLTEKEVACYETGSEPVVTSEGALTLERLLEAVDQAQARIAEALTDAPERLHESVEVNGRDQPLGQRLAGLHWHETYHTGQLEILRQLAGTDDAIV